LNKCSVAKTEEFWPRPATQPLKATPEIEESLKIVLPAGGRVTGTVYHDGRYWSGQEVAIDPENGGIPLRDRTDASGAFAFVKVPPGPADLRMTGWLDYRKETRELRRFSSRIQVQDEKTIRLDVRFRAPGGALEGAVTRDGKPAAAWMTLYAEAAPGHESREGGYRPKGTFRFDDVPAGKAVIHIYNPEENLFRRVDVEIPDEGGTTRKEIEISRGATIQGKATCGSLREGDRIIVKAFR
jgi:hypothetical protein